MEKQAKTKNVFIYQFILSINNIKNNRG